MRHIIGFQRNDPDHDQDCDRDRVLDLDRDRVLDLNRNEAKAALALAMTINYVPCLLFKVYYWYPINRHSRLVLKSKV